MYDDYMRNLLGFNINSYQTPYDYFPMESRQASNIELENMYPDIYKIVYPMVQKACLYNTRPITEDTVNDIVREVHSNIETGNIINVNINVDNSNFENNRETDGEVHEEKEITVENRNSSGSMNDLIKILVIRELRETYLNVNVTRNQFSQQMQTMPPMQFSQQMHSTPPMQFSQQMHSTPPMQSRQSMQSVPFGNRNVPNGLF